eukprot:scaffold184091_cov86-Cyclotella_meneghiniana.AAC.1
MCGQSKINGSEDEHNFLSLGCWMSRLANPRTKEAHDPAEPLLYHCLRLSDGPDQMFEAASSLPWWNVRLFVGPGTGE